MVKPFQEGGAVLAGIRQLLIGKLPLPGELVAMQGLQMQCAASVDHLHFLCHVHVDGALVINLGHGRVFGGGNHRDGGCG